MPEAAASIRLPRERTIGWALRGWILLVGVLLIAPTLVVIPMSFSASQTFQFPPSNWSFEWYNQFFGSSQWISSLVTSLEVGVLVALFSTVLGVGAAVGLHRSRIPGRAVIRSLLMAPMIMPGIVVAVAIYSVFLKWHLTGFFGFVLADTTLAVPLVVIAVTTSLASYDASVETASASLGANPVVTFFRVTLPLIRPGVLTGLVFAFVTSLDEVVIALFLQTPNRRTLPVEMYDSIVLQINPTIAAASSLIVVFTTVILLLPQLRRRSTQ